MAEGRRLAEAFNLPVVPEVHVHLIGAVPNGLTVEYMPRLMRLLRGAAAAEWRARHADGTRARAQI